MDAQTLKYVPQGRAAILLGLPEDQLRRISRESGLGHTERAGGQEQLVFTYAELRQVCMLAVHQAQ